MPSKSKAPRRACESARPDLDDPRTLMNLCARAAATQRNHTSPRAHTMAPPGPDRRRVLLDAAVQQVRAAVHAISPSEPRREMIVSQVAAWVDPKGDGRTDWDVLSDSPSGLRQTAFWPRKSRKGSSSLPNHQKGRERNCNDSFRAVANLILGDQDPERGVVLLLSKEAL